MAWRGRLYHLSSKATGSTQRLSDLFNYEPYEPRRTAAYRTRRAPSRIGEGLGGLMIKGLPTQSHAAGR